MSLQMRKTVCFIWLLAALCAVFLSGCGAEPEESRVDLADSIGGSSIVTAADLIAFLEKGESDTATLSGDISLEEEMLCITKERSGLVIDGNGFTISGAGDCVIRLEDGCAITLLDITIHSGSDAIGCLGDASIGGSGINLIGVGNGIRANGQLTVLAGGDMVAKANIGTGVIASGIILENEASLTAQGPMGGISVIHGDILLSGGARLAAYTEENYNALKCGGMLAMEDGASLIVENMGQYHGAEINDLAVEGAVTIQAKGGENSSGLFLFEQLTDITVAGYCEPGPRFESGKGSIEFVERVEDVPPMETPNPTSTPESDAETE